MHPVHYLVFLRNLGTKGNFGWHHVQCFVLLGSAGQMLIVQFVGLVIGSVI